MKKFILFVACTLSVAGSMLHAQSTDAQETVARQDSTVDVIGWFAKNDTLDYWINESKWKISGEDTVMAAGVSTKVRIVVTDSTSKAYKMDYTFLEFYPDSLADSAMGKLQNTIVKKYGDKIVGTTVHFETDEYGEITKFNNLSQIKKQAKAIFKGAMSEVFALDEVKQAGISMRSALKEVDTDELIDGYLEELKMLFMHHGRSLRVGEFTEHEDATATSYENDTNIWVSKNDGDGTYEIETRVTNIIPKDNVKAFLGGLAEQFTDKKPDEINKTLDEVFDEDATYENYVGIKYLGYGIPYRLLKQTKTQIKGVSNVEQTTVTLDY